jgi:hypothetical protein
VRVVLAVRTHEPITTAQTVIRLYSVQSHRLVVRLVMEVAHLRRRLVVQLRQEAQLQHEAVVAVVVAAAVVAAVVLLEMAHLVQEPLVDRADLAHRRL